MLPMFHGQNRLGRSFLPSDININDQSNLFWVFLEDLSYIYPEPGVPNHINLARVFPNRQYDVSFYFNGDYGGVSPTYLSTTVNGLDIYRLFVSDTFYPFYLPNSSTLGFNWPYDESPLPLYSYGNTFFGFIEINPDAYIDNDGFIYSIPLTSEFDGDEVTYASCWIDDTYIYLGSVRLNITRDIFGNVTDISLSKTIVDSYAHGFLENTLVKILITGSNKHVSLNGVEICTGDIIKSDLNTQVYSPSFYSLGHIVSDKSEHFYSGLNGYIYETIYYPRLLSGEEENLVEDYFNNKYNIW